MTCVNAICDFCYLNLNKLIIIRDKFWLFYEDSNSASMINKLNMNYECVTQWIHIKAT